jgi:hypothetical protein
MAWSRARTWIFNPSWAALGSMRMAGSGSPRTKPSDWPLRHREARPGWRQGVESVVYGEGLSRPKHDHQTGAAANDHVCVQPPSELAAPSSKASLYGERTLQSSTAARLDLAVEAPTWVIYGEDHSRPDQHGHHTGAGTNDHAYVYSPPVPFRARCAFIKAPPLRRRRASVEAAAGILAASTVSGVSSDTMWSDQSTGIDTNSSANCLAAFDCSSKPLAGGKAVAGTGAVAGGGLPVLQPRRPCEAMTMTSHPRFSAVSIIA